MSVVSALLPRRRRSTKQPGIPRRERHLSPAELIELRLGRTERQSREFPDRIRPACGPRFTPAVQVARTRPQPVLREDGDRGLLVRVRDGLQAWNPGDPPAGAHPYDAPVPPDVAAMLAAVRSPLTADRPTRPAMSRAAALRADRDRLPGFRAVTRVLGWHGVLPVPDPAPPRYVDPADWAEAERLYNADVDAALAENGTSAFSAGAAEYAAREVELRATWDAPLSGRREASAA